MFWPPFSGRAGSGAPSIVNTWPLPVSATNPIPERAPVAPVQLTVHSITLILVKSCDTKPICLRLRHPLAATQQSQAILISQHNDFVMRGAASGGLWASGGSAGCLLHLLLWWIQPSNRKVRGLFSAWPVAETADPGRLSLFAL